MSAHSETDDPNGEGDGVWSPDIEEAFEQALKEFPPCGRRKTILQGEAAGKMYGRNELIAKFIEARTGKIRTRKQVSSHIQVLARRKLRTDSGSRNGTDTNSISPASSINNSSIGIGRTSRPDSAMSGIQYKVEMQNGNGTITTTTHHHQILNNFYDIWTDRPIVTQKIRLVEFSAFIENRLESKARLLAPNTACNPSPPASLDQAAAMAASLSTVAPTTPIIINNNNNNNNSNHMMMNFGNQLSLDHNNSHNGLHHNHHSHNLENNHLNHSNNHHNHHHHHHHHSQVQPLQHQHNNQFRPGQDNNPILAPDAIRTSHPLDPTAAANHNHLSAQFNQASAATYQHLNGHHNQNRSHQNGHHLANNGHFNNQMIPASPQSDLLLMTATGQNGRYHHQNGGSQFNPHHRHHQHQSEFVRHSYIKIDYRQSSGLPQESKLEEIAIEQIQDKFPEIGEPDGLFQRGPTQAFFLVKFWADIDSDQKFNHFEDQNSFFGISSHFETIDSYNDITCSTKACSYGHQVVEKVEKMYPTYNRSNGRYSYSNGNGVDKSPTCEFMTQFIKKLRQLPSTNLMNSVLENFTVLQVVTSESTSEILLCLAYVFEIASPDQNNGSQYHVYKLSKGSTTTATTNIDDVKPHQAIHPNLQTIAMAT